MVRLAALLLVLAAPASAECPALPDTSVEQARLTLALRRAPAEQVAREIQNRLWQIWLLAPDADAQAMLDRGLDLREGQDLEGSRAALDDLVAYCPDYVEGYNQRAYSAFLADDYRAALADLEVVIAMKPDHVPALAGLGLTLLALGRIEEARRALADAVRGNPWIAERSLLTSPPGQEL
jgi:tetratricopeptide (TPR) repeat protein